MVGAEIRGQRRVLPETRHQRGRAAGELNFARAAKRPGLYFFNRLRSEWRKADSSFSWCGVNRTFIAGI
jgi:hypothetical protein